ncbi:MAG TPA: helix-turn-helix domain-containing protein [Actinomycetes bacterium]|nr:helix-turn-helix domain-containing protein [Actinomycetes bacterium]
MHDHAVLGAALLDRRRQLGLSQQELADLAGVAVRSVHAAEHGKPTLRLDTLTDITEALGLELRLIRRPVGGSVD